MHLSRFINQIFAEKEPWQVCAITTASVLAAVWIWDISRHPESLYVRGKNGVFRLIRKLPSVSKRIDEECQKVYILFQKEIADRCEGLTYNTTLPETSLQPEEILDLAEKHVSRGKYKWDKGYVSGTVYYCDKRLLDLVSEVYRISLYTNPLHSDVFPGVVKMEAEIIKMVAELFHGTDDTCGSMTSGGTESILMACKAYRDYALHVRGVRNPEMVIPVTAHAAFDKAGSYLGIRVKHVRVDDDSMCVNIKSMEHAISKNTVMLVGSTPNFPYGTMDDIGKIAKLGLKYNIPVHVDCCLGSFVIAFLPKLGYNIPPFDFSVSGVTSLSIDTHKYGFAPKGSSIILYSERQYRHHQYYASLSWPGGLYGSPSVSGSRSGAVIACCWATMMYFGKNGYMDAAGKIMNVSRYIEEELRKIPGIFVFGKPATTVIAIGSNVFNIYRLSQALGDKSWNLNMLQFPLGIHICITHLHTQPGVADRFISDVRTEVENIMENPDVVLEGKVAMYGMSTTIPDRTLVGDFTRCYIDAHYYTPKEK